MFRSTGPCPFGYDDELRLHNAVLRRACDVQPRDHVLDIGCGGGQTTCETASLARAGSALGVDVSVTAIERARELARARGLRNVTFECADAQVHRFPAARFDLATSRFGVMLFREPVYYGPDVATALNWVSGFASTSSILERLDPAAAARALQRLGEVLASRLDDTGVWFGSRAWIIAARRR